MSHYAVLVFLNGDQDLSDLLAPYNEELECEQRICTPRAEFIESTRKYYKDEPEVFELSDDDFIEEMRVREYELDENGNEITTSNPQAHWDWWSVGGRWSDILKLTDEALKLANSGEDIVFSSAGRRKGYCNAAKVKHLDFSGDDKEYKECIRFWELYVEKQKPESEEEEELTKWEIYKPEYYLERYKTKEQYAEAKSRFSTWAVVTPDGVWHQKGNMGWFACSDESDDEAVAWEMNFKEKFVDTADPEWVAVLVDCHI